MNTHLIIGSLQRIPQELKDIEIEIEQLSYEYSYAKNQFDLEYNCSILKAKNKDKTDTLAKSLAIIENNLLYKIVLQKEAMLKMKQVEAKKIERDFDAVKKIANIEEALIRKNI